jgi:hypothetical protein
MSDLFITGLLLLGWLVAISVEAHRYRRMAMSVSTPLSPKSQAYVDGYKAGRADRRLGIRSEYAWHGEQFECYTTWYAEGYRRGILGLSF